nr:MAG TPA: tail completion protein [Caudoviricetes sp.]
MKDREKVLIKIKETICPNVYFTPPEDIRLKYPACIVTREDLDIHRANNNPYMISVGYKLVYVSKSESDDVIIKVLNNFKYSDFRTEYKVDGLYHKVFIVYE